MTGAELAKAWIALVGDGPMDTPIEDLSPEELRRLYDALTQMLGVEACAKFDALMKGERP